MQIGLIIVAAGQGARAGGEKKQFRRLAGKPLVRHSLDTGLSVSEVMNVVLVVAAGDEETARAACAGADLGDRTLMIVPGGSSRTASVRAGMESLAALPAPPDAVLIHDAARPRASRALFARVCAALNEHAGVAPAVRLIDALKTVEDGVNGGALGADVDRDSVRSVQTPQGFHFAALLDAYRAAPVDASFSDDVAVARSAGIAVSLVAGDPLNSKITLPRDHEAMEAALSGEIVHTAVGSGFDVHRIVAGDEMMLCGVAIPGAITLEGHSDADAGLHALTDALLGALALGDIGDHFPPSDPQWAGAPSRRFVEFAVERAAQAGAQIAHVDLTVICERPKLKPHREAMRAAIAEMLGIDRTRVSVKATTTEALGFTGRGEGLAAQATATLVWRAGALAQIS